MIFKGLKYVLAITFLTLLTQVGGIIFLISRVLHWQLKKRIGKFNIRGTKTLVFLILYLLSTFLIIPPIAKHFGRVPLPIFSNKNTLQPLSPATYLLNRHYVTRNLKKALIETSNTLNKNHNNTVVHYLDANFPFLNGFPLFPHLSHNDGKKVDLAFLYFDTSQNAASNQVPSYFGYGAYVAPRVGEPNTTIRCKQLGYWQYGLIGQILPVKSNTHLILDEARTKELLILLLKNKTTTKVFIEPHLKTRLLLSKEEKIRFHGCHAVRHDDHIHLQQ